MMERRMDVVWMRLARLLPRRLVYWCGLSIIADATTGEYSDTVVPELTAMDAVDRFARLS